MGRRALRIGYILGLLGLWPSVLAQVPEGISYQALARDSRGDIVSEKQVSVRISVSSGAAQNLPIYVEKHDIRTNSVGLFTLTIGK